MVKQRVGLVSEIPSGSNKVVTVRGREIAVFNAAATFMRCSIVARTNAQNSAGASSSAPESEVPERPALAPR
jgi:hypothetical protein